LVYNVRFADFSDGGSEGSLDDVRQHPGIIKGAKSDDHEYLTLYEAHLSRLEEVGNPAPGLVVFLGIFMQTVAKRTRRIY
jgi:hypothetical protein